MFWIQLRHLWRDKYAWFADCSKKRVFLAGGWPKCGSSRAAKLRHFDLLVIIPATLQRDRSKLQTVRETWAKDIDSKTHLCQRHGEVKCLFRKAATLVSTFAIFSVSWKAGATASAPWSIFSCWERRQSRWMPRDVEGNRYSRRQGTFLLAKGFLALSFAW